MKRTSSAISNIDEGCFVEYNFHGEDSRGFRAILHTANGMEVKYLDSPFLREVNKFSVDKRIPRAAILAMPAGGKYRSFTFLPWDMMETHLGILYRAAEKFGDSNFRLLAARKYSHDVWNWI